MRVERLSSEGWTQEDIAEIHGPIGLDLKAKSPSETAIAILAEVIRVRYGEGSGESLFGTDAAIHTG
jgi:xanthine dehydrogenase accessory factor